MVAFPWLVPIWEGKTLELAFRIRLQVLELRPLLHLVLIQTMLRVHLLYVRSYELQKSEPSPLGIPIPIARRDE